MSRGRRPYLCADDITGSSGRARPTAFLCTPCHKADKRVVATNFCRECDENMCQKCVQIHRRFPTLRGHKIHSKCMKGRKIFISEKDNERAGPSSRPDKSRLEEENVCSKHEGKVIELYCEDHEELCCSPCVATAHRTCNSVVYIPDIAQGVAETEEFVRVRQRLNQVKVELDTIRVKRQSYMNRLAEQKIEITETMEDWRKYIIELLENLEDRAKKELDVNYNNYNSSAREDSTLITEVIDGLAEMSDILDTPEDREAAKLFINMKIAKENTHLGAMMVNSMASNIEEKYLLFSIDQRVENLLLSLRSIGRFENENSDSESSLYLHKHNISMSSDASSYYWICGFAKLPDDKMLITDCHNSKVKLLDEMYQVSAECSLPGKPWGVCVTGPSELAVTLTDIKKIQFITIDKTLQLTRKFDTLEACRGVVHHNETLFTVCGGGYIGEGEAHMRVFSITGELLKKITKDSLGKQIFTSPKHLALSLDGNQIHVTDTEKGIITLDTQGHVLSTFHDETLIWPFGVCTDKHGTILVSGYYSNNILRVGPDGRVDEVILTQDDGIDKPICLYYNSETQRLMVALGDNKNVKIFQLKSRMSEIVNGQDN